MSANDVWIPIPFAKGYFVTCTGRVGSIRPYRKGAKPPTEPRELSYSHDKNGYKKVGLYNENGVRYYRVCRLVCEVFHGPAVKGLVVRHLDGSKTNDSAGNLVWGTPKENSADRDLHGTKIKGSAVNTSRLTEEQVKMIRESSRAHSDLARELGVTPSAIWHIRVRKVWKHV
jgi:hypothetical protein